MAATIEVGLSRAYITGGKWFAGDAKLAQRLQALTEPDQVPASAPDADNYLAAAVAEMVAGRVVALNPPAPDDLPPLAVY